MRIPVCAFHVSEKFRSVYVDFISNSTGWTISQLSFLSDVSCLKSQQKFLHQYPLTYSVVHCTIQSLRWIKWHLHLLEVKWPNMKISKFYISLNFTFFNIWYANSVIFFFLFFLELSSLIFSRRVLCIY